MTTSSIKAIFYREAPIAVVSPLSNIRIPILRALKQEGFNKIQIFKSLEEYQSQPDRKAVWIITHLFGDMKTNALNFMKHYYEIEDEAEARFSLILNREESQAIPEAFQLGCLSCYSMEDISSSKDFLTDLNKTLNRIKESFENKTSEAAVAASYVRDYLQSAKLWSELISLESSLCKLYPRDGRYAIYLADAYFMSGDYKNGRVSYDQILQMHPVGFDKELEELRKKYPKALLSEDKYASKFNIDRIVFVESDKAEAATLNQAIKKLGVDEPFEYSTFSEAWEAIKGEKEPDLLICEWSKKKSDLTADQFVQRVRGHGFNNVPLVIMANQLNPNDSQLINDMHAIQIIKKPLREHDLLMSLAYAIQQYRSPTERKTVEYKIEQALNAKNKGYATFLKNRFIKDKNVSAPRKYYVEALFQFHMENYEKARNLLIKGIKLNADASHAKDIKPNIDKTILLAKCLFKLGDKNLAIQMMERAKERSPYNITILIDLVQMNYEAGNIDQASANIEQAEAIDAGNAQVVDTMAMMALYKGDVTKAQKMIETTDNLTEIISKMNNDAVGLIKSGNFEKGIDLYKSAIESLGDKYDDLLGVVYYNLALAYLRKDLGQSGMEYLSKAKDCEGSRVQKKAENLLNRCHRALDLGRRVSLLVGKQDSGISSDIKGIMDSMNEETQLIGLRHVYVTSYKSAYVLELIKHSASNQAAKPPATNEKQAS